jgi:hypothetical protein
MFPGKGFGVPGNAGGSLLAFPAGGRLVPETLKSIYLGLGLGFY